MRIFLASFSVGLIFVYCHGGRLLEFSGATFCWLSVFSIFGFLICHFSPRSHRCPKRWSFVFLTLAAFLLGAALAVNAIRGQLDHISALPFGKNISTVGYFCSLPSEGAFGHQVDFCFRYAKEPSLMPPKDLRVRLSISHKLNMSWFQSCYHVEFALTPPRAWVNPAGFDFEKYLFARKIVGFGKARSIASCGKDLSGIRGLSARYHRVRHIFVEELRAGLWLMDDAPRSVAMALIAGDRSQFDRATSRILLETGTQHLIAISGLHVGTIVALVLISFSGTPLRFLAALGVGLIYVVLAGMPVSGMRAWIMCTIWILCQYRKLKLTASEIYLLALVCILILTPHAPLDTGFWFSFSAVAVLLLYTRITPSLKQLNMLTLVNIQWVILIGLLPIYMILSIPLNSSALIANVFWVPIFTLVILPLALLTALLVLCAPPASSPVINLLNELIYFFLDFAQASLNLKLDLSPGLGSDFVVWVMVCIILGAYLWRRFRLVWVWFCCFLAAVLNFGFEGKEERFELVVFDVGQGLAALMRSEDEVWLYDVGPSFRRFSAVDGVILPFLRQHNLLEELDGVVLSHADWDHAAGIDDLLRASEPPHLLAGEVKRLHSSYDVKQRFRQCEAGQEFGSNQLKIKVLHSSPPNPALSSNNHSCVIKLQLADLVVLFMGDLEGSEERAFLRSYAGDLRADILIAGHHGAKSATGYALLKRVRPRWVVFSSGYNNRFGHPHMDVLARVSRFDAEALVTANSGAIGFRQSEGREWDLDQERLDNPPFWRQE